MGLVSGKKALVMGIANNRSLAYFIADKLVSEGAELAVTYQGTVLQERVERLAETMNTKLVVPCDVTKDDDIDHLFETLQSEMGGLDILVHAIAYADKEALAGKYYSVSRQAFAQAMDIGAYSFTALARGAAPLMGERGGSMVTLSYYGAEKVVPHYNVMGVTKAALEASVRYLAKDLGEQGIRVNGLSAGPVKTLSAKGISGFSSMLGHVCEKSPLQRNTTGEDVGAAALFLLSSLSSGVTGEIMHVDTGYNIIGI